MKQTLSALLAVLVLVITLALPAAAEEMDLSPPELSCAAYYVVNLDTGLVVCEKNSEQTMEAASLTKLMTMILMLKYYQDQLDTITVTAPGYIYDILYGKNGSTADIRKGETHTLRSLMYAMEVQSGNEAAYIVADYMGAGDVDAFVAMMNEEAAALGCTGTSFTDPCGLDPGNVTTARDAYLMLRAALAYDAYAECARATTYEMPAAAKHSTPYNLISTVKIIDPASKDYYRGYCVGGKTGSLMDWQNFAGMHVQDGISYISVVLHSPLTVSNRPALTETGTLMDWVLDTYTVAPVLDVTQPITELPVIYCAETDTIMVYPADTLTTLLPKEGGAITEKIFRVPDRLTAPVHTGDVVGLVSLTIDGEVIGTTELLAGSEAKRSQLLYTIDRVKEFFRSTYFKVLIILLMIVAGVYLFLLTLVILGVPQKVQNNRRRNQRPGGADRKEK